MENPPREQTRLERNTRRFHWTFEISGVIALPLLVAAFSIQSGTIFQAALFGVIVVTGVSLAIVFHLANTYYTRSSRHFGSWRFLACSPTEARVLMNMTEEEARAGRSLFASQFSTLAQVFGYALAAGIFFTMFDGVGLKLAVVAYGVFITSTFLLLLPRNELTMFLSSTRFALENNISHDDLSKNRIRIVCSPLYFRDAGAGVEGKSPFDETA